MKLSWDNYRQEIQDEIARSRQSLEPLEKGELRLASRSADSEVWTDTTDEWIQWHKQNIAMYEKILKHIENKTP